VIRSWKIKEEIKITLPSGRPIHGGTPHWGTIGDIAITFKGADGIYVNRNATTAGLLGSYRPDIVVMGWNGQNVIIEVRSPSQAPGTTAYRTLMEKIAAMERDNPKSEVRLYDLNGNREY